MEGDRDPWSSDGEGKFSIVDFCNQIFDHICFLLFFKIV
jgi:hypothetical protein